MRNLAKIFYIFVVLLWITWCFMVWWCNSQLKIFCSLIGWLLGGLVVWWFGCLVFCGLIGFGGLVVWLLSILWLNSMGLHSSQGVPAWTPPTTWVGVYKYKDTGPRTTTPITFYVIYQHNINLSHIISTHYTTS